MVVQILITERQDVDPLPQQFQKGVLTADLPTTIPDDFGHCPGQRYLPIDRKRYVNHGVAYRVAAEIFFTAHGSRFSMSSTFSACGSAVKTSLKY